MWLRCRREEVGHRVFKLIIFSVTVSKPNAQITRAYLVTTIRGPASNLRTKKLSNKWFAVAFNGKASPDGTLFNPETAEKPQSSAREYDRMPVRIWDHYITPEKNALWYMRIEKHESRYGVSPTGIVNALRGTGLEQPHPDPLFGGDFDLSAKGILFTAIDPGANQAILSKNELYYISVRTYNEDLAPPPHKISIPNYDGSASSPVFSPDGKSAVFLRAKEPGDDFDQPRIFLIRDTDHVDDVTEIATSDSWDLRPLSLIFSSDAKILYLTAEDRGRMKVFKIPIPSASGEREEEARSTTIPTPITTHGSVASVHAISPTLLLLTVSSLTESSIFATMDPYKDTVMPKTISCHTDCSSSHFAQYPSQVSDITFPSAHGTYNVQAFVVRPSSFSPSPENKTNTKKKTFPLLFFIHGGPMGSFLDAWSTRLNPAVFAEQGYIVILPNITGSTGFGQDFINGVKGAWGGRPYNDLVACFEYVQKEFDYVDTNRAVAMGGSYGGYMINWIAGQPSFAKNFKALVCHDGIFSLASMLASDEVSFLPSNFKNRWPWEDLNEWEKWDPARHTDRWSTPMLIIHSEKDYRCPITQGLAAFGVCQAKGLESKFLNFEDEGHLVLGRENSLRWHQTVLGWCDRYCGVEREEGN